MQFPPAFKLLRYIILALVCLAFLFVTPGLGSSLLCLDGSNQNVMSGHPLRRYFFLNKDPKTTAMVAASKAYLSPVVFRGTLLSVMVQRDGTVRASFNVEQVLKTFDDVPLNLGDMEVVYFKRPEEGQDCLFDVNEENLRFGTQYVVFGRPLAGKLSSVTATAFPIPYEKRTFRAIKKVVCKGCAKPPRVAGLKNARVAQRRRLRIQCRLLGNPIPWVEWYRDGKRLSGKGRARVRTKRRTSRLTIRQSRLRDSGIYECRAVNVVKGSPASAKSVVTITKQYTTLKPKIVKPKTTTAAPNPWLTEPCPNSEFCLNKGNCTFYPDVREYVCHCAEGYIGLRCDHKDVKTSLRGVKKYESREVIP